MFTGPVADGAKAALYCNLGLFLAGTVGIHCTVLSLAVL
jgi:hypothetical protein